MRLRPLLLTAFAAFLLDQISKYAVVHAMGLVTRYEIDVLPPLLNFRYGENTGINFGLFGGGSEAARWTLIGLSILVVTAATIWVWRSPKPWHKQVFAGLMIGGALGNVADRLMFGYVQDFLNMSCCGFDNPYVFNVADVFIFAGAAGLVLFDTGAGKGAGGKKRA